MKLGCTGCLTIIISIALAGGIVWGVAGLFQTPDVTPVKADDQDWRAAQQKIFDVAHRSRSRSRPGPTLSFTEREVTAVVARRLTEATGFPLSEPSVRLLAGGVAEISGRLPLRTAVREAPLASVLDWLPGNWTQQPVWMVIGLRPHIESGDGGRHYIAFDVEYFDIGRRRLPNIAPRLLLPTAALRYLSVPLPESVEAMSVERGKLVLRLGS